MTISSAIRAAACGALALLASVGAAAALDTVAVTEGVWALVGDIGQRSPENLGNNATFGVIVTPEGVVLIDPGGSREGAAALDAAIGRITDAPVKIVVDTGGQDHRWLGNGYWKAKGARIVASAAAVADQHARGGMQIEALKEFLGDRFAGTEPVFADTTFETETTLSLGGVDLVLRAVAPAHTPGDLFVWLPDRKVVFAGDIVYVDRLLGVGPQSNSAGWVTTFEAMAALAPAHVVPGHGQPTTLAGAKAATLDYLVALRGRIRTLLDRGGGLAEAPEVDQSAFAGLAQFDALAARNAAQVYTEMEME
jgi:glyoxylase-like metal-dependent hydrolase (beta-lactamase superfamily II)